MPMCEKCWADAFRRMRTLGGEQSKHYHDLLAERILKPCTKDEQDGIVRCPKHGDSYGYCAECVAGE